MLQVRDGLDLGEEALGADHGGQLGPQHLDRDLAVVLEVLGEVHRGHAAGAELALDAVAVGEGGREVGPGVGDRSLKMLPHAFLVHGGTIVFIRAYATSWPRCSCRSLRV